MGELGGDFNSHRKFTRRDFLKLSALARAAIDTVMGWDYLKNFFKEPLHPIPNNVLIVDFAPER